MSGQTFFDPMAAMNSTEIKSGLCSICKGSRRLCGKDRCPLMIKFYSQQKTLPMIETKDLAGSSPPAVFVGRFGYPKVDVGPLIPPEFGDTSIMDTPERWVGKSIDEIVDFRFKLVRGKIRIDACDFKKSGRVVDDIQEIALTERPLDIEAEFSHKPRGRLVMDDEVQPFGPSARMTSMKKSNGRFERNLERSFYDTDMKAVDAVISSYRNGTLISEIEKAFSVGTMGVDKRRRFVPTRWSITAVDDIIGKDLLETTKFYGTIDDYRIYQWEQLDDALHLEVRAHRGLVSEHDMEPDRTYRRHNQRLRVLRRPEGIRPHRRMLLRCQDGRERASHQRKAHGGRRDIPRGAPRIRHARRRMERQGERQGGPAHQAVQL